MRRAGLGLLLATVVAGAAGCGGGGSSSSTIELGTTNSQGGQPQKIVVTSQKGAFSPEAIYRKAQPGVVTILSVFHGVGLLGNQNAGGEGSGFVLDKDGQIVTNAHVVTDGMGADIKPAKQVYVQFADRNRVPAQILGYDPHADVAVLKIDPKGLNLYPLELADGKGIAVGQPVVAIGSPFGETLSLSSGVISGTNRVINSLTSFQIDNALQTDAAINPGNSGGPLLDSQARVIGINQQIESRSGSNAGVAFAVPVSAVRRSIDALRADGHVDYAYLGVSSQALYPQIAAHLGIASPTGALIAQVVPGGPADKAGLKGGDRTVRFEADRVRAGGDVIVAVDGRKLVNEADLSEFVSEHKPGDTVTLQIIRDGQTKNIDVVLGKRPLASPG